jgi:hypothetical protein
MKGKTGHPTHEEYIAAVEEGRRADVRRLHDLVREVAPALAPTMAAGFLGYGPFHYRYASGREGDTVKIGIAANKQSISLYCCAADERGYVAERFRARFPKASVGKGCVRFRRLADLDEAALRDLIRETAASKPWFGGSA